MDDEDPTTTDTESHVSADDDSPTVLVTAGTGTVGRHVVAALADEPVDLRVASRDPDRARETLAGDEHVEIDESALDGTAPDAVEFVAFDLGRPETYYPTLSGVDRLLLVRPPAVSRVERDLFPFVDAAARMGVAHVVFLSVLGAEKNPLLPHRRVESHLTDLPVDTTFLRAPSSVRTC
ncbi:SDR family oxidoreductase [Salinirubrum litoreum]|uniref:SDR family oxidoreductase n=1 Tax=Salinirubrum litoreum TaxID=1126234 RepID=A0ABD5RD15_9EURY|nr:NAD(P)H-binding protein [Salinirubrum litoreum]